MKMSNNPAKYEVLKTMPAFNPGHKWKEGCLEGTKK